MGCKFSHIPTLYNILESKTQKSKTSNGNKLSGIDILQWKLILWSKTQYLLNPKNTNWHRVITFLEPFCLYWLFDGSEVKMVLHNSFLKFDFAYIMVFLWQYSKKNYRKIPKSSKIYIKCQILNCLGFNNYRILVHEINFHWRISMSVNIFPLEVFDFGVSRYSITLMGGLSLTLAETRC